MEYATQAWSPWLIKDVKLLQRIYRRATKLVEGMNNVPFHERLKRLNLFEFQYRRMRGDLILTYKILRTPNHPLQCLLQRKLSRTTRSHDFVLNVPNSRVNCRRYFFTVRVSFLWNSLPSYVVDASSVDSFKHQLDLYISTNNLTEPIHS